MESLLERSVAPLLITAAVLVGVAGALVTRRIGGPGPMRMLYRGLVLAAAYGVTALVGLQWAAVEGAGSPVWPAAGVGLAGLLLGGIGLWPAILVGRLAAAVATGSDLPLWAETGIAIGNAASTVLAALLLRRWLRIDLRLTAMRDVVYLSAAALVTAAVSALTGVAMLGLSVGLDAGQALETGLGWFLGTGVGTLIVAPLALAWSYPDAWRLGLRRWLGLAALILVTAAVCVEIFFGATLAFMRTWYVYPAVIWIAVVYKVRGVAPALLIVAVAAIWSATIGAGPFAALDESLAGRLSLAQQFAIITTFVTLILAAAADERRGAEALARSAARETSIVETAVDPIIVIDEAGRIVSFNPAAERTFGYAADEVVGENVRLLMPEPHRSAHDSYLERYHRTGEARIIGIGRSTHGQRKDGSIFPLDASVGEWRSTDGRFYTGILREQTQRIAAEEAVRASERRLALAIDASGGGVYEQAVPANGGLHLSPRWLEILGYDSLPVAPERFEEWLQAQIHPDDRERRQAALADFIEGREPRLELELRKRHMTGRWIWVRSYAQAVERDADGRVVRMSGMILDITDRKTAKIQVAHLATHDTLTGLPNRALFTERLTAAAAAADEGGTTAGLVLIDLDNFKNVNDTQGHPVGDALLQVTARRLGGAIRGGDTAARIGGDEFAVVLPDAGTPADVEQLARRICRAVVQPARIEGNAIDVRASLGAALYPADAADTDVLMRHADLALYEAKTGGHGRVLSFYPALAEAARRRARVDLELRRAIERNELLLHYQPQICLERGRIRAFEALVRWPWNGALFPPGDFIPIAESTGAIRPLGAWVIGEACRQQARWREQGHDITMAVNVSPAEANTKGFITTVDKALARAGLEGDALELEITEGLLIDPDKPSVRSFLDGCQERGIALAIDDFGMGYSSLGYLGRLPISKIKIDQSFVSKIGEREDDDALVEAIVTVGHRLGKRVVAEGVETCDQLRYLKTLGCEDVQGYLLGKPMEPAAIEPLLHERRLLS